MSTPQSRALAVRSEVERLTRVADTMEATAADWKREVERLKAPLKLCIDEKFIENPEVGITCSLKLDPSTHVPIHRDSLLAAANLIAEQRATLVDTNEKLEDRHRAIELLQRAIEQQKTTLADRERELAGLTAYKNFVELHADEDICLGARFVEDAAITAAREKK